HDEAAGDHGHDRHRHARDGERRSFPLFLVPLEILDLVTQDAATHENRHLRPTTLGPECLTSPFRPASGGRARALAHLFGGGGGPPDMSNAFPQSFEIESYLPINQ